VQQVHSTIIPGGAAGRGLLITGATGNRAAIINSMGKLHRESRACIPAFNP